MYIFQMVYVLSVYNKKDKYNRVTVRDLLYPLCSCSKQFTSPSQMCMQVFKCIFHSCRITSQLNLILEFL